jgi:hypothetical protein
VAAGLTAHSLRERAQALVVVGRGPGPSGRAELKPEIIRAIVALARAPSTAEAARAVLGPMGFGRQEKLPGSVTASADPASGLVRINATADTAQLAQTLADVVASETTFAACRLVLGADGTARLVVGDFEDSAVEWRAPSSFNRPPTSNTVLHGGARFNAGYLRVKCAAPPGCGPTARVAYPFERSVTYRATLWALSPQRRVAVGAILGSSPQDVAGTPPVVLTTRWRRILVTWTPRRTASSAEVGLQTSRRAAVTFDVDGVLVSRSGLRGGGTPPGRAETQAFGAARYAYAIPARSLGEAAASDTVVGGLVGGAAGLLAALVAVGAGFAARRRGEQQPQ